MCEKPFIAASEERVHLVCTISWSLWPKRKTIPRQMINQIRTSPSRANCRSPRWVALQTGVRVRIIWPEWHQCLSCCDNCTSILEFQNSLRRLIELHLIDFKLFPIRCASHDVRRLTLALMFLDLWTGSDSWLSNFNFSLSCSHFQGRRGINENKNPLRIGNVLKSEGKHFWSISVFSCFQRQNWRFVVLSWVHWFFFEVWISTRTAIFGHQTNCMHVDGWKFRDTKQCRWGRFPHDLESRSRPSSWQFIWLSEPSEIDDLERVHLSDPTRVMRKFSCGSDEFMIHWVFIWIVRWNSSPYTTTNPRGPSAGSKQFIFVRSDRERLKS